MSERLWGIKIWDATGNYFYTEVDISQSVQHNRPTSSVIGYNSQYPFHIHDGIASYFSGSCKGNFSENQSGECESDYNFDYRILPNGSYVYNIDYMKTFVKWLHNDLVKHLQLSENLVIPVGILGEVQWETNNSLDDGYSCSVSFNWEQLDDEYSLLDTDYVSTCSNCGAMVAPTANYCHKCGAVLE